MQAFEFIASLKRDISGATAVEYGLVLALIFLAIVGAVEGVGTEVNDTWDNVSSKVSESSAQARG